MKGDALASGQKAATFSAGKSAKDEPIEFHGTVAVDERPDSDESWKASEALLTPKSDFSRYRPMNDRLLLRKIVDKSDKLIVEPEYFARNPPKAEVVATPEFCMKYLAGDVVFYGEYNAEEIELEGEKLLLVAMADIRLKVNA